MTFDEAVTRGLFQYATFTGRAGRAEFWYWMLFLLAAYLGVGLVGALMGFASQLTTLFSIAMLLPTIAAVCRRMHDLGRPGWFGLVPGYNLVLAAQPGEPGANRYGPPPASS